LGYWQAHFEVGINAQAAPHLAVAATNQQNRQPHARRMKVA
jgi:hypothetical protein